MCRLNLKAVSLFFTLSGGNIASPSLFNVKIMEREEEEEGDLVEG